MHLSESETGIKSKAPLGTWRFEITDCRFGIKVVPEGHILTSAGSALIAAEKKLQGTTDTTDVPLQIVISG